MTDTRPKALATEAKGDEAIYLRKALEDAFDIEIVAEKLETIDVQQLKDVEVLLPFIHSFVGRSAIEAMPKLRLIATRSTGFDHIDMEAAKEHGIVVANVPGYGETAVAEYTFALLLTLSRKVNEASERTQRGDYTLEGLRGFDLYHKTLGVVGAGAIGLHVIRIAIGFGMNVLAFDTVQSRLMAEVLGFKYAPLDELLAQSDIVTLHAPALPATYHMLNHETIAKMKHGAYLINTARGSLVDTHALAWALDTGILAGAGLDALEGEEFLQREEELLNESGAEDKLKMLVQNHSLQRRSNVIITPHVAFNSDEALRRILDTTIENARSFLTHQITNAVRN
jgi:D-lactate dehydrogenase